MNNNRTERAVKEYKNKLMVEYGVALIIIVLIATLLGLFLNYCCCERKQVTKLERSTEILKTLITLSGLFFTGSITAFGIFITSVRGQFEKLYFLEAEKRNYRYQRDLQNRDEYWKYLAIIAKTVLALILANVSLNLVVFTFVDLLNEVFWGWESYIMLCYNIVFGWVTFNRFTEFFENPFSPETGYRFPQKKELF